MNSIRLVEHSALGLAMFAGQACSPGETQVTVRETIIFRGTVTDADSGGVLTSFCAEEASGPVAGAATYSRYADVIHVKAGAGKRLREQIQWERRMDRIEGPAPPERDEAFWCGGGGQIETNAPVLTGWACMTAVPPNPAATVQDVQPLGGASGGYAEGYALTVQVAHTGVVWTTYDAQCSLDQYKKAISTQIGEMTIEAP
jgi:hypothetical protein